MRIPKGVMVLFKSKMVLIGMVIIILVIFSALAAPLITSYAPTKINLKEVFMKPSFAHLLGTDHLGRDIFTQIIYGARLSILVAVVAVAMAAVIGIPLGLIAGYFGRWIDNIISRLMDVIFAFPSLLLAIAVVAFLGPSIFNMMLAIGIVYIASVCRITRSAVLTIKHQGYIDAAVVLGYPKWRIIFGQILPNAMGPIVVQLTLLIARAILYEASLSFLGLGTPPPTPSWGRMISDARSFLQIAPWTALAPGITIVIVVMSINFVGDGLRDYLDPRIRRE